MSKYGTEYRVEWMMADDATIVRASIFDTENLIGDSDDVDVRPLTGSGNPLTISIIDNDKDKFTQIKSRQAKIEFLSTINYGSEIFVDSADNRWYVDIRINPDTDNKILFLGFLSIPDIQEAFQPDPNIIILTATDHLGKLKDINLTDLDGLNPTGENRLMDYLMWSLRKTGLTLNIRVVNNLRHGTGVSTIDYGNFSNASSAIFFPLTNYLEFYPGQRLVCASSGTNNGTTFTVIANNGGANIEVTPAPSTESGITNFTLTDESSGDHFYEGIFIDAKTFESEIGESEDCYSVTEKVLGEDCFVTQYNGEWWIFRIDEWDTNQIYVADFDSDGVFDTLNSPTDYNKSIGASETFKFVLADALMQADPKHGVAKLTYRYRSPLEVPCNIDFSRGDYDSDLSSTAKKYALDCWDQYKENWPTSGLIAADADIYIRRDFNSIDYEIKRYVVITDVTVQSNLIMSEAIPVQALDKISVSMTRRMSADVGGSGFYRDNGMQVRLYGDDGTYWVLQGETSGGDELEWVESDVDFITNNKYLWFEGDVSRDMTEAEELYGDTESPEIPVDGYIKLLCHQTHETSWNVDTYIDNVGFTYIPFINGSYRKYSGQYQKVSREITKYLTKRDKEIYVSDSPKKLFKGALLWYNGTKYLLTTQFYPYNVFPSGIPSYEYAHPYGELQIRSVFNQYRNANRIFNGTVKTLGLNWCDLIHKYELTDTNNNTNNRYFMLTSFEQNWKTGFWTGNFIEVWNTDGKVYTDDREFKYIAE